VSSAPSDNRNGMHTATSSFVPTTVAPDPTPKLHQLTASRTLGLLRKPHQRNLRDTSGEQTYDDANPASSSEFRTADDMETYDFLSDDFHPLEDDDAFRRARSADNAEGSDDDDGDDDDEEERIRLDLEEERKAKAVRDELDRRTGRLWTDDWEITDDDWFAGKKFDDLPDWSPELCSRVSLERVKVLKGGVPTLSTLSALPLPSAQPPHPSSSDPKLYIKHARRSIQSEIQAAVEAAAGDRVAKIMELPTWEDKQDAVDELFESVEDELRHTGSDGGRMAVLAAQPSFGDWVEAALERHLKSVVKNAGVQDGGATNVDGEDSGVDDKGRGDSSTAAVAEEASGTPTREQDEAATPIFIDVLGSEDDGKDTPSIVHPLTPHHKEGTGRMVEEWELAANKGTKRIMLRQCVRDIAQTLVEAGKEESNATRVRRVYVKGGKGVGKTATLAAVVASARQSGQVVLYLPDGDRLRKLGKYIRPNNYREGSLYDLPVLAKEVCSQFLESHGKDLEDITIDPKQASEFLSEDDLDKISSRQDKDINSLSLVDLLEVGCDSTTLSSGCYATVIDSLMNQTDKPFVVVMDGFNCYFDHGHYFHETYDPDVIKAIPFQKITLLKPLLEAMGLEKAENRKALCRAIEARPMKRGAIVVGTTESHSVARKFTDALSDAMEAQVTDDNGVKVVNVLPYSPIEVEHIVANFETIGVGRLRFDRGDTVMNDQEVAYLRLVSGGVGQNLLDSCII